MTRYRGSRRLRALLVLAACGPFLFAGGEALAQAGEKAPGGAVPKGAPKAAKPSIVKQTATPETDKAARPDIVGNFGEWTLLCGKPKEADAKEPCSLAQALIERDSNKLVFRVLLSYGPKGKLVLQVDSPTGIALQRGLEFSPDAKKIYRMPFLTCVPQGCRALLVVPDELKSELLKSERGTLTVFALNGQAVQTVTEFAGLTEGLTALDKRRASQ